MADSLLGWLTEALGNSAGPGSLGNPNTPTPPVPQVSSPYNQPAPDARDARSVPPPGAVPLPPPGPPPGPTAAMPPPPALGPSPTVPISTPNNNALLPFAQGGDPMTAGGIPPNGPGLPPAPVATAPTIPMPTARPPGAGPGAGALPTDVSARAAGDPAAVLSDPLKMNALASALGITDTRKFARGLAAGLTAAGASGGKTKAQALFAGAGAGLTGTVAQEDKKIDEQQKNIAQTIAANNSEAAIALNKARTHLAEAESRMTAAGGKNSVLNSDQQLYINAVRMANADPGIDSLRQQAVALGKTAAAGISPADKEAAEKAQKAVDDAVAARTRVHMASLGLHPDRYDKLKDTPGSTEKNAIPAAGMTQEKFNLLPVGTYYTNPKTGAVLIKKPMPGLTAGAAPATPAAAPVTAPAGSRAAGEDEDEEAG